MKTIPLTERIVLEMQELDLEQVCVSYASLADYLLQGQDVDTQAVMQELRDLHSVVVQKKEWVYTFAVVGSYLIVARYDKQARVQQIDLRNPAKVRFRKWDKLLAPDDSLKYLMARHEDIPEEYEDFFDDDELPDALEELVSALAARGMILDKESVADKYIVARFHSTPDSPFKGKIEIRADDDIMPTQYFVSGAVNRDSHNVRFSLAYADKIKMSEVLDVLGQDSATRR